MPKKEFKHGSIEYRELNAFDAMDLRKYVTKDWLQYKDDLSKSNATKVIAQNMGNLIEKVDVKFADKSIDNYEDFAKYPHLSVVDVISEIASEYFVEIFGDFEEKKKD